MLKNDKEKIKTIIKMYNENYTYKKIAKQVNLSDFYVRCFIANNLETYNLEPRIKGYIYHSNIDKIIDLYNQGFTYNYTCKQINCSKGGLRDFIYRQLIVKNIVIPRTHKRIRKV